MSDRIQHLSRESRPVRQNLFASRKRLTSQTKVIFSVEKVCESNKDKLLNRKEFSMKQKSQAWVERDFKWKKYSYQTKFISVEKSLSQTNCEKSLVIKQRWFIKLLLFILTLSNKNLSVKWNLTLNEAEFIIRSRSNILFIYLFNIIHNTFL